MQFRNLKNRIGNRLFSFKYGPESGLLFSKPQDIETQWNEIISEGAFFSFSCFSFTLTQLNDHQIKSTDDCPQH